MVKEIKKCFIFCHCARIYITLIHNRKVKGISTWSMEAQPMPFRLFLVIQTMP